MAVTEDQLTRWAQGPSTAEDERCATAIRRITDALRPQLGDRVTVFLQGSYKNRTNIRQDSDVDIAVRDDRSYFADTADMSSTALTLYKAGFTPSDHTFEQFKARVHQILTDAFGSGVKRRNKCILVPNAAPGVSGDVVPCFEHRRFGVNGTVTARGIEFLADDGVRSNSFPDQHYRNGVAKNDATQRMYKRMVRILKNVRGALVETGKLPDDAVASFFIECLVFNGLPDHIFLADTYFSSSKRVIEALYTATEEGNPRMVEVSDLKYLFHGDRTAAQAREFLQAAYSFIGH